jgi:hypothetical protein
MATKIGILDDHEISSVNYNPVPGISKNKLFSSNNGKIYGKFFFFFFFGIILFIQSIIIFV